MTRSHPQSTTRRIAAALCSIAMAGSAFAADKVTIGYMKIPPLAAALHAERTGIFKANGLDVEIKVLNSGPALMNALAAGSLDITMDASAAVVTARAKGLPVKAFGTADPESSSDVRNWVMASESSGVKSMKDLEGKTVGVVAPRSPAEMVIRDHMLKAGGNPDKVKFVGIPFPQLQAALEVGNVAAVHVVEPFHTSILRSTKMKAVTLASGLIATAAEDGPISLGGWSARAKWLSEEKNRDIAKRFLASISTANKALAADRSLVDAIFEKDFGMPTPVAKGTPLPLNVGSLEADPKMFVPLIRALTRTGIIGAEYPVADVVETIKY